ncbi:MAG: hypothetical protein EP341_02965 [Sphingomonadales bacterium]|nr:MAG: hypothetical protein EP341_02965 [Sphingomonadales bacterium]
MSEKRQPLTRLQFAKLALEQEGKCAKCKARLDFENPRQIVDEHLHPIADHLEGSPDPNRMDNRALYCVPCAKPKTIKEHKDRSKAKRFERKRTQYDKRKEAGGSRIKSRGFQQKPEGYKYQWSKK